MFKFGFTQNKNKDVEDKSCVFIPHRLLYNYVTTGDEPPVNQMSRVKSKDLPPIKKNLQRCFF